MSVVATQKIPVPLLDLKAQYATIRDEVREAIDRVADSQYFIMGPEVQALEEEVAAYSQCKFGIGVSSGTDALLVAIMAIAEAHDLIVIEDAAQAIGSEYKGRRAGSIGHIGCFSFFPSKNLGGFGDGGMVVTNDPALAERLNILRKHGSQPKYYHKFVGGNFRLDALQAAVLRVKLRYLDGWTEERQENAARYRQMFAAGVLSEERMPVELSDCRHIYNQFILRCSLRDELMAHLKGQGIGCEVYYPVPMHIQECFADLGYGEGDFPVSETAADETLAIPIYPELTVEMQQAVVNGVANFYS